MKVIFNGMLSRDLVRRLSDLWPGSIQATAEYAENYPDEKLLAEAKRLTILNDRTAATELYLREHATEIEQFSTSNERYLEV